MSNIRRGQLTPSFDIHPPRILLSQITKQSILFLFYLKETEDNSYLCRNTTVQDAQGDVEGLEKILLNAARENFAINNQSTVNVITYESAKEYYSKEINLGAPQGSAVHLSRFVLYKEMDGKYIHTIKWDRESMLVSRNILRAKTTTKHLHIEHQPSGADQMQKLTLDLNSFMGCEINEKELTADVFEVPNLQVKDGKSWRESKIQDPSCSPKSSPLHCRIHFALLDKSNGKSQKPTNLLTSLSKNRLLQRALEAGLQSRYEGKFLNKEPHELYPLLNDPTLTLAAQRAVKTFTDCRDVQTAISLYKGLYIKFKALLIQRQQNLDDKEE